MNRKNMANKVLAGVFLLFILASIIKFFYKDLFAAQLFVFVTEAAVVGGVADWFAVTALFRKPLGFPWHTELITRHRARVIDAVTDMIEYELLSVDSIKQRVDKICFVSLLIDWVENKEGKLFLKNLFSKHSGDVLASIDLETVTIYVDQMFKVKVKEFQLTPHIKTASKWAVEHNKYERVVSCIVDVCIDIVKKSDTRQLIYHQLLRVKEKKTKSIFEKAVFWFAEQTDSVNLAEIADAIYEELLIILYEAKQTDHMLYKWIHVKLLEIICLLESPDFWAEPIEEWQQAVVQDMDISNIIRSFAQIALEIVKDSSNSPVITWLYDQTQIYWYNFTQNQQAQTWLESGIKQAVYKIIENEHQLIGGIVRSVLNTFSDDDLNQFIEDKAGDDLQWIRINGCVVGSVVGLGLFLFLHFIYDPFVVPVVQGIIK